MKIWFGSTLVVAPEVVLRRAYARVEAGARFPRVYMCANTLLTLLAAVASVIRRSLLRRAHTRARRLDKAVLDTVGAPPRNGGSPLCILFGRAGAAPRA